MREESVKTSDYIYAGGNPGNKETGAALFENHCSKCHSVEGEGIKAPALNNQEFLNAASNGYLLGTMTIGRSETKMPRWGVEEEGHTALTVKERQDIVANIRSWQRIKIKNK